MGRQRVGSWPAARRLLNCAEGGHPCPRSAQATALRDLQNDLSSLATVIGKSLGSEDVTSEVVDVQSRIASLRTSIARMQVLFEKAETIADVALVESELSRRQSDLESMLARQKELANLTGLGTITLTVQSHGHFVEDPVQEKGVLDGLKRGVRAVGIVGVGLATALAFLLPFLVVAAVLFVPVRLLLRRVRRLVNRSSGRRSVPGVKGGKQPNTTDPAPPLG